MSKSRRSTDGFWLRETAIWDMKVGYEKKTIEKAQLKDYYAILSAGYVNARKSNGEIVSQSIQSVNYLFDSKAGAEANRNLIADTGSERIFIFYLDQNKEIEILDNIADYSS
ncbi:MAG: hypothetical protein IT327_25985 [Anaerolineae bacterium]|nr:hypothetical protein [Anaerolineae bacterium]